MSAESGFLNKQINDYQLIETMRFEEGEILYQGDHVARLGSSCIYFDIPISSQDIAAFLSDYTKKLTDQGPQKIRLLVHRNGEMHATSSVLKSTAYHGPDADLLKLAVSGTVCLAAESVNSNDPWYQHKTTNRALYNQSFERAAQQGHEDMIFLNEAGHVTEGAISTIFVLLDGVLITPPQRDGLLPGILRKKMLASGKAVEQSVTREQLKSGEIFLGNALRGLRKVRLAN